MSRTRGIPELPLTPLPAAISRQDLVQGPKAEAGAIRAWVLAGRMSLSEAEELISVSPETMADLLRFSQQHPVEADWVERALEFRRLTLENFRQLCASLPAVPQQSAA